MLTDMLRLMARHLKIILETTALKSNMTPALLSAKIDVNPEKLDSGTDLLNATRGQYSWFDLEQSPEIASGSHYARFLWGQIEPKDGEFNTWSIDQGLERAAKNKANFGFRVMALMDTSDPALPEHIKSQPGTWKAKGEFDRDVYVPDWNSEEFLVQWEELMAHLGEKYNDDPRLGWVDVGGYGNWGEWHLFPYEEQYKANGKNDISLASAKRMIEAVQKSFPDKFVLLNTTGERGFDLEGHALPLGQKNDGSDWSNQLWQYALGLSDKIGIRNDSLGGGIDQAHAVKGMYNASEYAKNNDGIDPLERWKTAPVVTEWGPTIKPFTDKNGDGLINETDYDDANGDGRIDPNWERDSHGSFTKGKQQVSDYHISWLSSDNFSSDLNNYSSEQVADFYEANRMAGYRYTIDKIAGEIVAGGQSTLDITWQNKNVAPTYDDWQVVYEIKDASGQTVSAKNSALDLRNVLPDADVTLSEILDTSTLKAGQYDFFVKVVDDDGYHKPMNLDLAQEMPDDSYRLFNFEIATPIIM